MIFDAPSREDFKMQDIEWLRIRDFSVEAAEQKILEFINVSCSRDCADVTHAASCFHCLVFADVEISRQLEVLRGLLGSSGVRL